MVISNKNNTDNSQSDSSLKGTYVYEENIKYRFDGKENGALLYQTK